MSAGIPRLNRDSSRPRMPSGPRSGHMLSPLLSEKGLRWNLGVFISTISIILIIIVGSIWIMNHLNYNVIH